jgi:hypothetical protein
MKPSRSAKAGRRIPTALAATNPAATNPRVAELFTNSATISAVPAPMKASGKICPPYQPPARHAIRTSVFRATTTNQVADTDW